MALPKLLVDQEEVRSLTASEDGYCQLRKNTVSISEAENNHCTGPSNMTPWQEPLRTASKLYYATVLRSRHTEQSELLKLMEHPLPGWYGIQFDACPAEMTVVEVKLYDLAVNKQAICQ